MIRIALTHDIDRVVKSHQYFTKTLSNILKLNGIGIINQLKSIGVKKPYWTFDQFIEIESSYGIRSTVFFLNESIKLNPLSLKSYKLALGRYDIHDTDIVRMIQYLDCNGWEIGVHGSYNSYKDVSLLKKEKHTLEIIVGHPINGIRQHYLNLNENTWGLHENVGFIYDSSWGYTRDIGFKEDRYLPFHPLGSSFKVIPLVIMDSCFMPLPNKWIEYEKLLDKCAEMNAIMVINFHQHVFSSYDFPGYKEAYIELIERAFKRGANFFTLSQL